MASIKVKAIKVDDKEYIINSDNENEYKKIFNQWFPGEELTPTSLKEAPRRIIHEVLESVVVQEIEFCLKDIYKGQVGGGHFSIGEKTLLRLNLIKGHVDSTIVKFSLSRENIFSNLKKVLDYISPQAVKEVGQYFLVPGYGISNLFLLDMKKHQDEEYKMKHEELMSEFDELKKRDEETEAKGDADGDTDAKKVWTYFPRSFGKEYSLMEEYDRYLKKYGEELKKDYKEEILGDWMIPR